MSVAIRWFKKAEFDVPALKSPKPCIHGAGCIFTTKKDDGTIVPACCHFVHPGEEGNGRRLFPAVLDEKGVVIKPACVRLTGKAGFYERCRLKMSWQAWCDLKKIPYKPNTAGERHEPVKEIAITVAKVRGEAASLIDRLKVLVATSTISAEDKAEIDDEFEELFPSINAIISKVEGGSIADDAAALGKMIAEGAAKRLNDPVEKAAVEKDAADYIASNPGHGWDDTVASVKAAQKRRVVVVE